MLARKRGSRLDRIAHDRLDRLSIVRVDELARVVLRQFEGIRVDAMDPVQGMRPAGLTAHGVVLPRSVALRRLVETSHKGSIGLSGKGFTPATPSPPNAVDVQNA